MRIADEDARYTELLGQLRRRDPLHAEVYQPGHPVAWGHHGHTGERSERFIAVPPKRSDPLVDPVPADVFADPAQTRLQRSESTGIHGGDIVAACGVRGDIIAIVIAHSKPDA